MPLSLKSTRRRFMTSLGAMAGAVAGAMTNARNLFASPPPVKEKPVRITGFGETGDPYQELGVPTVINGQGTMTVLGGSLMHPEVEAVMALGAKHFCSIPDLEVAAGNRIAQMLKLPDGYTGLVTCGAAAAMQAGLAGILTGTIPTSSASFPISPE